MLGQMENFTMEGVVLYTYTEEPTTNTTIPSTVFTATANTLVDIQWANLLLSSIAGVFIHVYIAFSVLKRKLLSDKYMVLTYMRSYIDVIYIAAILYMQEVFVMVEGHGFPRSEYSEQFLDSPASLRRLVVDIKRLAQQLQMLMLMMMIVHRFLLFTRPGAIGTAYGLFFLVVLVFCSATGVIYVPSARGYDAIYMVTVSVMVIMAAVVHSSLKNYFTAHKYSTNVCEMQGKTSKFLLYCILIYSVCYVAFPLISIFCSGIIAALVSSDPHGKTLSASAISYIIGQSLVPWLPLADGILTLWSVKGYLSEEENTVQTRISVVQTSSESQC